MTLEAIKEAISELPTPEKTTLAQWLNMQDSEAWDQQLESDFSGGGSGMALLAMWDAEIKAGNSVALDEFLTEQDKHSETK
jgi:hypothetical protein